MRRSWIGSTIVALLVAGLVVLVGISNSAQDRDAVDAVLQVAGSEKDAEAEDDRGPFGPPPWAQSEESRGKAASDKAQKHAWKEAWKALTPAQREAKMAALAKEHEEGMRQWSACMEAAAGDAAKRAECTKPLPPGLAKRLP